MNQSKIQGSTADVFEISTLLRCGGFKLKSVQAFQLNTSQDAGIGKTITMTCHLSGVQIVLECPSSSDCTCPRSNESSFYQVSGVSGGVVDLNKETGSAYMDTLPKNTINFITDNMQLLINLLRNGNENEMSKNATNGSAEGRSDHFESRTGPMSLQCMKTPPGVKIQKPETPTRYRSLDTLTSAKNEEGDNVLPKAGVLQSKEFSISDASSVSNEPKQRPMLSRRQSTYSIDSLEPSRHTRTSSPIKKTQIDVKARLMAIESMIQELLRNIKDNESILQTNDVVNESLDVSKISLKPTEISLHRSQYKSSPNLSRMDRMLTPNLEKPSFKRGFSSSTTKLPRMTSLQTKQARIIKGPITPTSVGRKNAMASPGPVFKTPLDNKVNRSASLRGGTYTPLNHIGVPFPASVAPGSCPTTKKRSLYSHVKSTIPKPNFLSKKDEKRK